MLNMPGPSFLFFYGLIAFSVFAFVRSAINKEEDALPSNGRVRDPYEIAFLRGGTQELVRVVALSLTLRGALRVVDGKKIVATDQGAEADACAIERAVLRASSTSVRPGTLAENAEIKAAAATYAASLTKRGLLTDAQIRRRRLPKVSIAVAVLLLLSVAKITVALGTGHRNIGFLILMSIIVVFVAIALVMRRRTAAGNAALQNLGVLFRGLKTRPAAAEQTDLMMLAAVYGVMSGPGIDARTWRRMFATQSDSSGGGGCGSGCGGGGGCGGGCGGCGS